MNVSLVLAVSSNNEYFYIFRYSFARVSLIVWRDPLDENESKHERIRTILIVFYFNDFSELFLLHVITNFPNESVFVLVFFERTTQID